MRHARVRQARRLALLGVLLIFADVAIAAPPQINSISPLGVQRGVATDVVVAGAALGGNPRLVAPFAFQVAPPSSGSSDASNWRLRLTADSATPVGIYPVRLVTDEGPSNLFLLAVGQLPQVAEKEENNVFEAAQAIEAPAVVEGQCSGSDVDYFRFAGKKGQRVVVDAQCARIGAGVDPSIRLTTADRQFVASADDTPGLITDARLTAVLPRDGDYVVELSDSRYQGGGRAVYRLVVGAVPAAEEVYPLGGRRGETLGFEVRGGGLPGSLVAARTLTTAPGLSSATVRATVSDGKPIDVESIPSLQVSDYPEVREPANPSDLPPRVAAPAVLNGRIDPEGDEDRFVLAVAPGQKLRVEVKAADIGSALDGVLQVLNPTGGAVANGDDTTIPPRTKQANAQPTISPDPSLDVTVPAGVTELTLVLRDLQGRGGIGFPYRVVVTESTPGFELALNDGQVSVPKGGTAAIGVSVVRKGYNGPISLGVADPPPGLTVQPGTIAEGQLVGAFSVSAATDASFGFTQLRVTGEGKGATAPITRVAVKEVIFAQLGNLPTNTLQQTGLAAAPGGSMPVALEVPGKPVEVAHGYGAPIVVKAKRGSGADAALTFSTLPLPPGLTVPAAKLEEKKDEATVTVNTAVEAAVGTYSIVLQAKGKLAGADQTLSTPTIVLDVVRPAAIELEKPSTQIKAGTKLQVKGKVVRKGAFKEPVTVKLNGLPAGLKAEPVTVAPDASAFTLEIASEEKAAATKANASVALAFQVNKKDYPAQTAPLSLEVLPAK